MELKFPPERFGLRFGTERFGTEEGREVLVLGIEHLARGADRRVLGCLEYRTVCPASDAERELSYLSRLIDMDVVPDPQGKLFRCDFVRDGSAYSAAVIPVVIGENGSSVSVPVISLMQVDPKLHTTVATADLGTREYRWGKRPFRVCQTGPARFYDEFPVDRAAVYNRLDSYGSVVHFSFFDFPRIADTVIPDEAIGETVELHRAA